MEIALTWDLVVLLFFIIIMSYSFIVGQNGTIKIVLSSYIAMLTANGLGNLASKYILLSEPVVKIFATTPEENVILFKMLLFVGITLILVLKGSFEVDISRFQPFPLRLLSTTIFGFLSAGLVISTLVVFIAGASTDALVDQNVIDIIQIPHQTLFVHYLITYYNFWFAAPAMAFVLLSVVTPSEFTPATVLDDGE